MAEASQFTAAVSSKIHQLPIADRVYDLASLLGCIADRVAEVHSLIDPSEAGALWDALRSIRHCQGVAGAIAADVEEVLNG